MGTRRDPAPDASDLRALAHCGRPVLSLLVPVTAAVPDAAQNPVRHARVVKRGLQRLRALGAEAPMVERAARELAGFAAEDRSPAPSVAARAAFWSPDGECRVFGLPFSVNESARVGSCAVVRPLARALQRPDRYRVLLLSAKRVALYEGDARGLAPVEAPELPASLEDALGSQLSGQALQLHSSSSSGSRPIYHGQGGASRAREIDLERFHQRVARGLEASIGNDVVPLVLAADARHRPGLSRALHRDVGLLDTPLHGNAEHLSDAALHDRTWPLVVECVEAAGSQPVPDASKPLVTRLSEIVSNAAMGRIRRLWVPEGGEVPARMDDDLGAAAPAWGDDDLIESLAVRVLRRGGTVRVLPPERSDGPHSLAAELW
jgi:hypothetical protein